MIKSIRILTIASAFVSSSLVTSMANEVVTLISDDSKTNSLTLAKGESAKLTFARSVQIEGTVATSGGPSEIVDLRIGLEQRNYVLRSLLKNPDRERGESFSRKARRDEGV